MSNIIATLKEKIKKTRARVSALERHQIIRISVISVAGLLLVVIIGVRFLKDTVFHKNKNSTPEKYGLIDAGNTTFSINGQDVALHNGTNDNTLKGDLVLLPIGLEDDFNHDKVVDKVAVLREKKDNGTMSFYVAIVLVDKEGKLTNTKGLFLADNVRINRMFKKDDVITLEYQDYKKPPTVTTRYFGYKDGNLIELKKDTVKKK